MKKYILCLTALLLCAACSEDEKQPSVVKVDSISIEQGDLTLTEGESVNLSAVVLPEDATDKTITWTSSDEATVIISSNGKAAGIVVGTAVVTAKAGEKSDFITITVVARPIPVTGISLDKPSLTIKVGEFEMLTPIITPEDATNKNVSWTSSNDELATVENGKVVGVKTGSVIITATTEDGSKTAECPVTVKSNLPPSVTVGAEHITAICAILKGEANLGSTTSSDLTMGIMWSTNSGVLPSNSTKIEATEIHAREGTIGSYHYSVNIDNLDPATIYYFRSYVTQNGQDTYGETKEFKTQGIGSLIETTEVSDVEATKATLNAKLDLTEVLYGNMSYGFYWGASETSLDSFIEGTDLANNAYSALLTELSHKTQYWYRAGVTLDRRTFFGEAKTFTTAVVPVESVSLDKPEHTFHTIDSTLALTATVLPNDATDKRVEWSSDNEDVAIVDANGKVTAKSNGKATITVTTTDQRKTATCEVSVAQWVTGLSLDHTSLTLNEGQEQILIPTVNPSTGSDKSISWTSSDISVATVDDSGKVTAVSKGTATIKATANDGSGTYATCSVTVKRVVSSIQLDKASISIYNEKSETITATVIPSDASNKAVIWSSSNASVATVSSSGVVTGKSRGTATITVTAIDGNGASATCEVEVKQYVTGISIDETSLSLFIGEDATLSVTSVLPDNANDKSITWTSSDISVATVDDSGKVTAVSKGTATIKATANDGSGKQATCSVTVKKPVSSIQLNSTSLVLYRGASDVTETLTATVIPSDASNTAVTWSSSNASVATVSSSGVVTGKSRGTATITVTAIDGNGASATCEVEVKQYVTGISINKTSLSLFIGEDATLSVTSVLPSDANNKSYTWSSSDSAVASVDDNGKVTAKSKGTATIKATANDGSELSATCSVSVAPIVSSIVLDKTSSVLYTGRTETINATVLPADASCNGITWTSSNTNVATVSENGEVYGITPGNVTITAKANDVSGKEAYCEVEVRQSVTNISLNVTSLDLTEGDTWQLVVTISPEDAFDKTVNWSTPDWCVTVDKDGLVRAISKGKAVVTVSTNDGSGIKTECSVVVSNPCPLGAVDMGTHSANGYRVYWAAINLSTCSPGIMPEDYGDYYAWGETETYYTRQNPLTWKYGKTDGYKRWGASYKWYDSSHKKFTRYCPSERASDCWGGKGSPDNKTEFRDYDYEDDAARVGLGSDWRTPTNSEWAELLDKCTWTWTTQEGVNGQMISAPNGNSIFLPAAGYRYDSSLGSAGTQGLYWSSSLDPSIPSNAWCLFFNSSGEKIRDFERCYGLSIRPVTE